MRSVPQHVQPQHDERDVKRTWLGLCEPSSDRTEAIKWLSDVCVTPSFELAHVPTFSTIIIGVSTSHAVLVLL